MPSAKSLLANALSLGPIQQVAFIRRAPWMRSVGFHLANLDTAGTVFFLRLDWIPTSLTTWMHWQQQRESCLTTRATGACQESARFNRSVQAGKVMEHEMAGLMLDMMAMLCSTRGRKLTLEIVHGKQKEHFQSEDFIQSWIHFLEMQLQLVSRLAWIQGQQP